MVTPAFAGDRQDVSVSQLSQALVRPDDDGVIAVEVTKRSPARLAGTVQPRTLAAPRKRVALALIALDTPAAT